MAADFCFGSLVDHIGGNHKGWVIERCRDGSEKRLSYGELFEHSRALAQRLKAAGVEPREIIGLKSRNRLEWLVWELAAVMCDLVLQVFPEDQAGEDEGRLGQYHLRLLVSETVAPEASSSGIFDIASTLSAYRYRRLCALGR